MKDFFSNRGQTPRITFTERIRNGKLHFLCNVRDILLFTSIRTRKSDPFVTL